MRVLRILSLLLASAAVGIAVGCGGGDDEEAAAPATETEAAGGGQTVEMSEYEFVPNDLTVKKGETITAENTGTEVHNFTIEQGPDPEQATDEIAATPDVSAGDSGEVTVDADPGDYALVCTISNHRELGMVGTIKVE